MKFKKENGKIFGVKVQESLIPIEELAAKMIEDKYGDSLFPGGIMSYKPYVDKYKYCTTLYMPFPEGNKEWYFAVADTIKEICESYNAANPNGCYPTVDCNGKHGIYFAR